MGGNSRSQSSLSLGIQGELDYHSMIHEHIRNAYPDMQGLSHEMLKGSEIPHKLLEQNNQHNKIKQK